MFNILQQKMGQETHPLTPDKRFRKKTSKKVGIFMLGWTKKHKPLIKNAEKGYRFCAEESENNTEKGATRMISVEIESIPGGMPKLQLIHEQREGMKYGRENGGKRGGKN